MFAIFTTSMSLFRSHAKYPVKSSCGFNPRCPSATVSDFFYSPLPSILSPQTSAAVPPHPYVHENISAGGEEVLRTLTPQEWFPDPSGVPLDRDAGPCRNDAVEFHGCCRRSFSSVYRPTACRRENTPMPSECMNIRGQNLTEYLKRKEFLQIVFEKNGPRSKRSLKGLFVCCPGAPNAGLESALVAAEALSIGAIVAMDLSGDYPPTV